MLYERNEMFSQPVPLTAISGLSLGHCKQLSHTPQRISVRQVQTNKQTNKCKRFVLGCHDSSISSRGQASLGYLLCGFAVPTSNSWRSTFARTFVVALKQGLK
jgi:hypothetical protein